jgi:hypothetical protein
MIAVPASITRNKTAVGKNIKLMIQHAEQPVIKILFGLGAICDSERPLICVHPDDKVIPTGEFQDIE